jgi:hypothetical protein
MRNTLGIPAKKFSVKPLYGLALLLAFIAASLCAPVAHAQYRASLRGTVSDPTGAVIPGATLTLINIDTNEQRVATSDASGLYTFNALPPAHFHLIAQKAGFKKNEITEVVLIPEQPNALNVKLELGDAQQTVTVNGSQAPLLDSDTATVSATISSNQIQHLPSYNRDVFQLAQLTPGVSAMARRAEAEERTRCPATRAQAAPAQGMPVSSRLKMVPRCRREVASTKPTASRSMASAR